VDDVQASVSNMEQKILQSVTNLVKVAKSTADLDAELTSVAKFFSKEKMDNYKKVGAIIAMIVGIIWGFLQYVGLGNVFHRH
jgi:ferritin